MFGTLQSENPLNSRCNSAFQPQPGLAQPDLTPVHRAGWYLQTVDARESAGGQEWGHPRAVSELLPS